MPLTTTSLTETAIIARYFQQPGLCADPALHPAVALGIGDDCALLAVPQGQQLALSMDVLVAGIHFPVDADASLVAQRALAVNLSDLAAMGAQPLGFTLGLTLPSAEETWLASFASGLRLGAMQYGCPLLGGNLTRGPLQICIQVQGLLPAGTALLRSGAQAGDDVYVSGCTGRAGLALALFEGRLVSATQAQQQELFSAYYLPQPRLALGQALRNIATAAQDVSDGLLGDLGHIAKQSGVQITVNAADIPIAGILTELSTPSAALTLALTAGDDYELVFTAPPDRHKAVVEAARNAETSVTRIGCVTVGAGVLVQDANGRNLTFEDSGYDHFGPQLRSA